MSETPVASSEPHTPPSSASEQARIRKERREAKIRAGGSARLDKITGLGGGIRRDASPQPKAPAAPSASHADPEEVDISQHFYEPSTTTRSHTTNPSSTALQGQINDDQLRQMMLGFDPSSPPPGLGPNPFGIPAGAPPEADDFMVKMLQQMMGGTPGEGANGMPGFPGMPSPATATAAPYAYLWRIVHALFALGLGLYMAISTPLFTGTRVSREGSGVGSYLVGEGVAALSPRFFYIFATGEVLLQTTRFFVEKGKVEHGAVLGLVSGFLPEPYKGYLALVMRYARIWTTMSADASVLVFVLGAAVWWRSI